MKVTLEEGKTYEIDLRGSGDSPVSDTFLRLYDENGFWVAENDDGPVNTDSRLVFSPTLTSKYFIGIGAYNDEFVGEYSISYTQSDNSDDFPLAFDTDITIIEGSIQEGTINNLGDEDYFKFSTNANAIYEFNLESQNSDSPLEDPLLTVLNGTGDILAVNDDFGGSYNSKIEFVI